MRDLGVSIKIVVQNGVVSNILREDYEAVLSFINAETQKKKLLL